MGRPPAIPAEKKARIVLSVLAGEMTIAEAAR
ncbi:MAG: helix-turn-helix domain-containing protein, partial [Actinophytocola sp.]|nr:helix-turn-helix domain-containing protein [Actinophytocola sp.]